MQGSPHLIPCTSPLLSASCPGPVRLSSAGRVLESPGRACPSAQSQGWGLGRVLFSSLRGLGREKRLSSSPEALLCPRTGTTGLSGWPGGWSGGGERRPALSALPSRVSETCREAGHRLHCDSAVPSRRSKQQGLLFPAHCTPLTSRLLLCGGQGCGEARHPSSGQGPLSFLPE